MAPYDAYQNVNSYDQNNFYNQNEGRIVNWGDKVIASTIPPNYEGFGEETSEDYLVVTDIPTTEPSSFVTEQSFTDVAKTEENLIPIFDTTTIRNYFFSKEKHHDDENSENLPYIILVIILTILVILTAIAIFLYYRKKNNSGSKDLGGVATIGKACESETPKGLTSEVMYAEEYQAAKGVKFEDKKGKKSIK